MNKAEEQKAIELFDNLINDANHSLLLEFEKRLTNEIKCSEQAIKEGFENEN